MSDETWIESTLAEIKRLYYSSSPSTIERDLARAIALVKALPSEEARERVAVYMDGLAQMKGEFLTRTKGRKGS
jgi:hypothetical protein